VNKVTLITDLFPAESRGGVPTREEAEAAVRVLIRWAGDDPEREGLRDTPKRVAKAYRELYAGYAQDARSARAGVRGG
jgi:GTP cyclohydrolase I